jgi:hypothetical protein
MLTGEHQKVPSGKHFWPYLVDLDHHFGREICPSRCGAERSADDPTDVLSALAFFPAR